MHPFHHLPLETAPPLGDLTTVIGWLMYVVIIICMGSFLVAAGKLGLALRNGGEVENLKGLLLTMVAAIVAGGAVTLANALL